MKNLYRRLGLRLYAVLLPLIRIVISRSKRVHVALVYDRKIILVKNWLARDTWRLPGGGVHKNESEELAVIREIREELGLLLNQSKLIKLGRGSMEVDRLDYKYSLYVYVLDGQPKIAADRLEIMDCGLFGKAPHNSQKGIIELMAQLEAERLL